MTRFTVATWNVNSLRVRLPHVQAWLKKVKPDVLSLQETKLQDADFPFAEIEACGYHVVASGQRTYNGVAIVARHEISDVVTDIPGLDDPQRRVLCATIGGYRILNLYVPNGESVGSEKYQYKLNWLHKLDLFLKHELTQHKQVLVMGDFNIAPADIDVHNPKRWVGHVLCSDKERQAFQDMLAVGLKDCFRALSPEDKAYSWWDYRLNAFKRNWGLRIDHILASTDLASHCKHCYIDLEPRTWERPSDHTPVVAEFA